MFFLTTTSRDPLIEKIASLVCLTHVNSALGSSGTTADVLSLAIESVESINRETLSKGVKCILKERSVKKWDEHLSTLTVQHKFGEACELKDNNRVWNRILKGLPAGQLSFVL